MTCRSPFQPQAFFDSVAYDDCHKQPNGKHCKEQDSSQKCLFISALLLLESICSTISKDTMKHELQMLRKYFLPVMATTLCLVNKGMEEKIKNIKL